MTFLEFEAAEQNANTVFDTIYEKCEAFLTASNNEYQINLKEARCKVLEENGTMEDLIAFESSASEGLVGRAKKTIDKMVEELKKFIESIIKAVEDFFNDAKVSLSLKKAESLAKSNPKVRELKFTAPDIQNIDAVNSKFLDQMKRRLAMVKSGKVSDKDVKDMEKDRDDHEKNLSKALKASITVTVSGAILLIGKYRDKLKSASTEGIEKTKTYLDNVMEEDVNKAIEIIKASISATKMRVSHISSALKSMMKRLSGVLRGKDIGALDAIDGKELMGESAKECDGSACDETQCPKEEKEAENNKSTKKTTEQVVSDLIGKVKADKKMTGGENVKENTEGTPLSSEQMLDIIEEMVADESKEQDTESINEDATPEAILESLENEIAESTEDQDDTQDDTQTAESILESLENEIAESAENQDDVQTTESILESLENEITESVENQDDSENVQESGSEKTFSELEAELFGESTEDDDKTESDDIAETLKEIEESALA